eukprot:gnl/MRDRNA2_/MRDRNA2_102771_c0_seq1.p1 gnl/MRDRNA2_/MRDRNA2_102771_c0~~gnl/MRDRNA2_/MRDRNA2_102771_c0_seq1.p1  ORF type:complete len:492 (+),score=68.72 gnl/MRDRNA2_/MRDRNA2_102771_c0_seq1:52-1527(+)
MNTAGSFLTYVNVLMPWQTCAVIQFALVTQGNAEADVLSSFFHRVSNRWPLHNGDLETAMIKKPQHLAMSRLSGSPLSTSRLFFADPLVGSPRHISNVVAHKLSEQDVFAPHLQRLPHHGWSPRKSSAVHRRFKELETWVVNHDLPHRVAPAMGPDDGLPFSVGVEVLSPGGHTVMPVNAGYKLIFVLSGSFETFGVTDEGGEAGQIIADTGDVMLFPPNQRHTLEVRGTAPCHMLTFILDARIGTGSGSKGSSEWVDWVRMGRPVGPLNNSDFLAMHPKETDSHPHWERLSQQSAELSATPIARDTIKERQEILNWPMQRSPLRLRRKHLRNAEGVAAVPTNALALIFHARQLPFNFALEDFAPGHVTPIHKHDMAHELFYILSGEGIGSCNGEHFSVSQGDFVLFPAGVEHALDNNSSQKLYALELMVPSAEVAPDIERWDFTCLHDRQTGTFACSELGFGEAIEAGRDADDLRDSDACGFVSSLCRVE